MPQEVQTSVWLQTETTLETIQAIGTSSVKIREGRQTTGRYIWGCVASGSCGWYYHEWETERDSEEILSTNIAVDSYFWKAEYAIRDYGVRVPCVWTYEITLHRWGWATDKKSTIIIKSWGKVLYTNSFSGTWQSETVTFYADLWRFSTIEIRWQFRYYGSNSGAAVWFVGTPTLTIKQL